VGGSKSTIVKDEPAQIQVCKLSQRSDLDAADFQWWYWHSAGDTTYDAIESLLAVWISGELFRWLS